MRYNSFGDLDGNTPLVTLNRLFAANDVEVLAKLEFLNPTGSIKDRPARFVVQSWLRSGRLRPGMRVVESTSGNFGVALAMNCALHGMRCTLVVDPLVTDTNRALMLSYGAEVVEVNEMDEGGGYLLTRLKRIHKILEHDSSAVWVNQYANDLNWAAHYHGTGAEIAAEVDGPIDYLVAALSTGGSIVGTARRLRESHPAMQVVAVDAVGSVIFGGPPSPRRIPGIGSSRRPEILDDSLIDLVVHVSDAEAISGCHRLLAAESIMAGGSSGSAIHAVERIVQAAPAGARIVTLLPDRGERYFGLVYRTDPAARGSSSTEQS